MEALKVQFIDKALLCDSMSYFFTHFLFLYIQVFNICSNAFNISCNNFVNNYVVPCVYTVYVKSFKGENFRGSSLKLNM